MYIEFYACRTIIDLFVFINQAAYTAIRPIDDVFDVLSVERTFGRLATCDLSLRIFVLGLVAADSFTNWQRK